MAKAKTKRVNKSQAIREMKRLNPNMMPKAIAERLTKKGIKVSAAQVSTTLFYAKRRADNNGTPAFNGELNCAAQLLKHCNMDVDRAIEALHAVKGVSEVL